jgi:hypothetical protein
MPIFKDISGERFGMLVVIGVYGKTKDKKYLWECLCDCGNIKNIRGANLTRESEPTRSCGCLVPHPSGENSALYKHGHAVGGKRSQTLKSYSDMIDRCSNPKNKSFKYYGERGIKVCDRWLESFSNFLHDMGNAKEGFSIERINFDGDYEIDNCKWIKKEEQTKNTRRNLFVDVGNNKLCLSDACKILGVNYWTGVSRHRLGHQISDKTISTPLNSRAL